MLPDTRIAGQIRASMTSRKHPQPAAHAPGTGASPPSLPSQEGQGTDSPGRPGLVVAHHGQQVLVEDHDGTRHPCHFRAVLGQLVTGDRVCWQESFDDGPGVVTSMMPRHSQLMRPDNFGNLKPMAANVDQMVVVLSPYPLPSGALLDRYIAAAEISDIRPLLFLNKTDLLTEETQAQLDVLLDTYRQLNYTVLKGSAQQQDGIDELRERLKSHSSILVGQSGAGKSSLINCLVPDAQAATAALSAQTGLGRHTTVTAALFHLPGGGSVTDSPGIRDFRLWHVSPDALLKGFRELYALAGDCRFRNCSHVSEPGCALHEAAKTQQIHPDRLANYLALTAELQSGATWGKSAHTPPSGKRS